MDILASVLSKVLTLFALQTGVEKAVSGAISHWSVKFAVCTIAILFTWYCLRVIGDCVQFAWKKYKPLFVGLGSAFMLVAYWQILSF